MSYWRKVFGDRTVDDVMGEVAWRVEPTPNVERRFEPWLRDLIRLMGWNYMWDKYDEHAAFREIAERIAREHGTFAVTGGARYGAGNSVLESWGFEKPRGTWLTLQEAVDEARRTTKVESADAYNPQAALVEYHGRGKVMAWHVFSDGIRRVL